MRSQTAPAWWARWSLRRRVAVVVLAVALIGAAVWGVQVLRVLRSVDAYAAYWSVPRGEAGGVVYVALGDSAAQGIGASRPETGYVSLVAAHLGRAAGEPVQIINLSTSGARIRDVLRDQVPLLDGLCADVITVGVGGNDIRDYDEDAFARDVTDLTGGLPRGTVLADLPFFMHGQWQVDVEEGNALLRSHAEAGGACSRTTPQTGSTPMTVVTGSGPQSSSTRCSPA